MKDLLKNYPYSLISHWRSGDETFEVIIGGTHEGKRIVFKTHLVSVGYIITLYLYALHEHYLHAMRSGLENADVRSPTDYSILYCTHGKYLNQLIQPFR